MRQTSEPGGLETLASRIRWIIRERQLKQTDFARSLGVSANYVYLLTSGRKTSISETLARLIEGIYGYPADWVLTGERSANTEAAYRDLKSDTIQKLNRMDDAELQAVASFIRSLHKTEKNKRT
ncbi:helix-turn-helix domain-containing protein [Intestinimonas butyriciproducens]|uniref:helix-turn-helix domain-containing protein n=1 Tax=Intestinimonas butyriciproducens TaxID=1297617 RepID=UPI00051AF2B6|nr:helix-turn-helix transcriptional regulator [Intestinimonas butyriciproducens]